MTRVISDLVGKRRPTSVTTFYDGRCPVCQGAVTRYRAVGGGIPDLLWRDVNRFPDALACFGIDRHAAERRIHVVDRTGALRAGVDAMIAIWRELPHRRWRADLFSLPFIHGLMSLAYDLVFAPLLRAWSRARAPLGSSAPNRRRTR